MEVLTETVKFETFLEGGYFEYFRNKRKKPLNKNKTKKTTIITKQKIKTS